MTDWFRNRWLDLVTSIYVYNEHRGYTALDRVLRAARARNPDDREFISQIERHRADERKHYLMFKRWFEKRGSMPLLVDRACGHIDRFVEIMFRTKINELSDRRLIESDGEFAKLCRVISLTEQRGFRQVETLLRHPFIRGDARLTKIYEVIHQDEPSHWTPYDGWLQRNGAREPAWWERMVDSFIHSELLMLKLPILFLMPGLARRASWPDAADAIGAADGMA